jgi:hypothetical protein
MPICSACSFIPNVRFELVSNSKDHNETVEFYLKCSEAEAKQYIGPFFTWTSISAKGVGICSLPKVIGVHKRPAVALVSNVALQKRRCLSNFT